MLWARKDNSPETNLSERYKGATYALKCPWYRDLNGGKSKVGVSVKFAKVVSDSF